MVAQRSACGGAATSQRRNADRARTRRPMCTAMDARRGLARSRTPGVAAHERRAAERRRRRQRPRRRVPGLSFGTDGRHAVTLAAFGTDDAVAHVDLGGPGSAHTAVSCPGQRHPGTIGGPSGPPRPLRGYLPPIPNDPGLRPPLDLHYQPSSISSLPVLSPIAPVSASVETYVTSGCNPFRCNRANS